jgi:hypothetical protein
LSSSKPQPVKLSNTAIEVHCILEEISTQAGTD